MIIRIVCLLFLAFSLYCQEITLTKKNISNITWQKVTPFLLEYLPPHDLKNLQKTAHFLDDIIYNQESKYLQYKERNIQRTFIKHLYKHYYTYHYEGLKPYHIHFNFIKGLFYKYSLKQEEMAHPALLALVHSHPVPNSLTGYDDRFKDYLKQYHAFMRWVLQKGADMYISYLQQTLIMPKRIYRKIKKENMLYVTPFIQLFYNPYCHTCFKLFDQYDYDYRCTYNNKFPLYGALKTENLFLIKCILKKHPEMWHKIEMNKRNQKNKDVLSKLSVIKEKKEVYPAIFNAIILELVKACIHTKHQIKNRNTKLDILKFKILLHPDDPAYKARLHKITALESQAQL